MLMWIVCIAILAGSYGLARVATPQTAGQAFPLVLVGVFIIAVCWRGFERVLWKRFPTKVEYTVAAKRCAQALGVCLVLQVLLVLLGR